MKIFTVTLTKNDSTLIAKVYYKNSDRADKITFSGDRSNFMISPTMQIQLRANYCRFGQFARYQAERCGAEITIEATGEEPMVWDNRLGPPDEQEKINNDYFG